MKAPTEQQIKEAQTNLEEIFESIKKHEGEHMSNFVHALVSSKQISDGIGVLFHLAAERMEEEAGVKFVKTIAERMNGVLQMAVTYFYKSTDESFDFEKAVEWAQMIDKQMDSLVERVRKEK